MQRLKVNIIAWNNGGGLSRDVEILASALPAHIFELSLNMSPMEAAKTVRHRFVHRGVNLARALRERNGPAQRYDINLFLEDLGPEFYRYARVNAFIPNPEWFRRYQHYFLPGIDVVLCKTRHAVDLFSALGKDARLIGFTSGDRLEKAAKPKDHSGFLHIAGCSWQKGTGALLDVWARYPDWPTLTIVQNDKTYRQSRVKRVEVPNVRHILERLSEPSLRHLQNSSAVHLCPSEVEGFGHCLVEAMSCGAVILTTDAPPMNEIVTPERGVLVNYNQSRKQRSGTNYRVDPDDLEAKLDLIMRMDDDARKEIGARARAWFEQNDSWFRDHLVQTLLAF